MHQVQTDWQLLHSSLTLSIIMSTLHYINVSFISFFVSGFWSLLAIKLRKYKNITQSLFTFCKARWARWKKTERKSRNCNDQNTKNQKTKIWDEQNKCPETTYISHIHLRASSKQTWKTCVSFLPYFHLLVFGILVTLVA